VIAAGVFASVFPSSLIIVIMIFMGDEPRSNPHVIRRRTAFPSSRGPIVIAPAFVIDVITGDPIIVRAWSVSSDFNTPRRWSEINTKVDLSERWGCNGKQATKQGCFK
jgi:hypothetical protein